MPDLDRALRTKCLGPIRVTVELGWRRIFPFAPRGPMLSAVSGPLQFAPQTDCRNWRRTKLYGQPLSSISSLRRPSVQSLAPVLAKMLQFCASDGSATSHQAKTLVVRNGLRNFPCGSNFSQTSTNSCSRWYRAWRSAGETVNNFPQ